MKAEWLNNREVDRPQWDDFVKQSPQGSVYLLSGYLDIVAPDWSLLVVRKDGNILAGMPLHLRKKGPWTFSIQPVLTQFWGVCFAPDTDSSVYQQISQKRKLGKAIVAGIPAEVKWFSHAFSPAFDYPLPFHWAGFELIQRITYQLDLHPSEEELYQHMASNTRYDLRKSESLDGEIVIGEDLEALLDLLKQNAAAGKPLMPEKAIPLLKEIVGYLKEQQMLNLITHRDASGKATAAGLFVKFGRRMIYLVGAQHPENKVQGLMARIVWRAMLEAKKSCEIFDFEGSMIEGVEGFFRGFGAHPIPLLHIRKNELPLLVRWLTKSR